MNQNQKNFLVFLQEQLQKIKAGQPTTEQQLNVQETAAPMDPNSQQNANPEQTVENNNLNPTTNTSETSNK